MDVYNPSTGAALSQIPDGNADDIDHAVSVADRAFRRQDWMSLGASRRARILWQIGDLIDAHAEELAAMESQNNGMPIRITSQIVPIAAECFRYFSGWATKLHGETHDLSSATQKMLGYTRLGPIGVAGLITPWNSPLSLSAMKIAAALSAGCTCVHKPSEEAPLTALRLAELILEAGVPEGVFNVVTGYGHAAGRALVKHPLVKKIAFTGSTSVGKEIIQAAAGNLKRVTLELGGKSPVIVLSDANLSDAIPGVAQGIYMNSGQICAAGSRLYAHNAIYDELVDGLSEAAKKMKIGDALDSSTEIGPLISTKQVQRVTEYVDGAVKDGARLITGGVSLDTNGYFFEPTIFADPDPNSPLVQDEIFGPVLSVMRFDHLDDVIKAANDSVYGLAAAVWTRDLSNAHVLADQLDAGTVWLNCQLVADPSMPFGGTKESGWGKELGREGVDAYLNTKSVFVKF